MEEIGRRLAKQFSDPSKSLFGLVEEIFGHRVMEIWWRGDTNKVGGEHFR